MSCYCVGVRQSFNPSELSSGGSQGSRMRFLPLLNAGRASCWYGCQKIPAGGGQNDPEVWGCDQRWFNADCIFYILLTLLIMVYVYHLVVMQTIFFFCSTLSWQGYETQGILTRDDGVWVCGLCVCLWPWYEISAWTKSLLKNRNIGTWIPWDTALQKKLQLLLKKNKTKKTSYS